MLEDILDRYYARKLARKICDRLAVYYIDKKVIYTKHLVELYIKQPKWKEENYVLVMAIPYTECFDILINRYTDLEEDVKNGVRNIYSV